LNRALVMGDEYVYGADSIQESREHPQRANEKMHDHNNW
jgi:hypothetical protein